MMMFCHVITSNVYVSYSQNMSTYKELCSIANDLNQPDLIYKFLHLANHHATWNTKKVGCSTYSVLVCHVCVVVRMECCDRVVFQLGFCRTEWFLSTSQGFFRWPIKI